MSTITIDGIIELVESELRKARAKFPSNNDLLHAFTEEAGEVTREFLHLKYHNGSRNAVEKELVQVMVMAIRLLQEGDPNFPMFLRKPPTRAITLKQLEEAWESQKLQLPRTVFVSFAHALGFEVGE